MIATLSSIGTTAACAAVLTAAALPLARSPIALRKLVIAGAGTTAVIVVLGTIVGGMQGGAIGLFRLLTAGVVLATVVSAPRLALTPRLAAGMLLIEAGALGAVDASSFAAFFGFWLLSLLPGFLVLPRQADQPRGGQVFATYTLFVLGATVPLAVALGLLSMLSTGTGGPGDVARLAVTLAPEWRVVLFALLAGSLLMRMAVAPLHGWLPVLLERGPLGLAVVLSGVPLGAFTLIQIGLPLVGGACSACLQALGVVGLAGGAYGAILALPQRDLRRLFAYLRVSQSGLLLAGIAAGNPEGVTGALLYSAALGTTMTGVLLVVWAMHARTGSTAMHSFGGLVNDTPSMAASFLILAFASIGFPGTLSFIAEDLLLHGMLGAFPLGAVLYLVCTAVNAISVLRVFQRTFLGQPNGDGGHITRHAIADLLPRERGVAFVLCVVAVGAGIAPGPLLALVEPAVRSIATLCQAL